MNIKICSAPTVFMEKRPLFYISGDEDDSDKENEDPQKIATFHRKMASQQKVDGVEKGQAEGQEDFHELNDIMAKFAGAEVKKEKGVEEMGEAKIGESSQQGTSESAGNPINLLEHEWADIRKLWEEMEQPNKGAECVLVKVIMN